MRLIFNTFFHLDPACGRLYPPNPPDIHRDRLFSRPLPPFPVSDSYRKREGLPNRFRAASHFFFLQRVETRLLPNRSWLRRSCVDTVQPLPRGLTGEEGVFETLSKFQNVVRLLNVSLMK